MRAVLLSALVLALAVPVGWAAPSPAGTLSIENGRGTVVLTGKGIVIGRLDKGDVKIVDLSPLDQWSPRVNGVPRGKTVWLRGKNVNFYVARRALQDHGARRRVRDLRARAGGRDADGQPGSHGRDRNVRDR